MILTDQKINDIRVNSNRINYDLVKRFIDIFSSAFFLFFIASWLFPFISILIIIETGKNPLFVQDRVGLNGKLFRCFKFRTLKQNDDFIYSSDMKYQNIASGKIGNLLRKLNLDELPQIFNVLLGEMSLVGPRPHAISYHEMYASYIPFINYRLLIKPGITGLAQINGFRGDVLDKELNKTLTLKRVEHDILYIINWKNSLDIYILLLTMFPFFKIKVSSSDKIDV